MQAEAAEQRPSSEEEHETAVSIDVAAARAALESAEAALLSLPDETVEIYETAEISPRFEAWKSAGEQDEEALGVWRDDGDNVVAELRRLQSSGGNYQVDLVSFDLVWGWAGLG